MISMNSDCVCDVENAFELEEAMCKADSLMLMMLKTRRLILVFYNNANSIGKFPSCDG